MCLGLKYHEEKQKELIDNMKIDENGFITLFKTVKVDGKKFRPLYFEIDDTEKKRRQYTIGQNVADTSRILYTYKTSPESIKTMNNIREQDKMSAAFYIFSRDKYDSGFHLYVNKKDAFKEDFYAVQKTIFLPVKVKKEWITAVGRDQDINGPLTVIAKEIMFPKIKFRHRIMYNTISIVYAFNMIAKFMYNDIKDLFKKESICAWE